MNFIHYILMTYVYYFVLISSVFRSYILCNDFFMPICDIDLCCNLFAFVEYVLFIFMHNAFCFHLKEETLASVAFYELWRGWACVLR